MTEEELRARLQAEVDKAINKVLAERPDTDKMTLREIERLAVQAGQEISAGIQQALGEQSSQSHSSEVVICPKCGSRMQQRGQHVRQVVTEAGRSQLDRVYCVCSGCGYSFFPLRRSVGLG